MLAQEKWIEAQQARMLDVPHFHVVFTLPAELRPLAAFARRRVFNMLFRVAGCTLAAFDLAPTGPVRRPWSTHRSIAFVLPTRPGRAHGLRRMLRCANIQDALTLRAPSILALLFALAHGCSPFGTTGQPSEQGRTVGDAAAEAAAMDASVRSDGEADDGAPNGARQACSAVVGTFCGAELADGDPTVIYECNHGVEGAHQCTGNCSADGKCGDGTGGVPCNCSGYGLDGGLFRTPICGQGFCAADGYEWICRPGLGDNNGGMVATTKPCPN
jgi:hypothetical protein